MNFWTSIRQFNLLIFTSLCAFAFVTACSLKKPEQVTPVPSEETFNTRFFTNEDGSFKKFLLGVAPESTAGRYGNWQVSYNFNHSMHANIIFDPYASEGWLIGRELSPSRLHGKARLEREDLKFLREVIRIPVTKRFYLEAAKDSRGRETNEQIENTSRSHWKARPKMKLNLSGIQILDADYAMFGYQSPRYSIGTISHIERNKPEDDKSFLGFSVMADLSGAGAKAQARFRVNFLEFETKTSKNFKIVPYVEENAQYVNTLHVIGRESGGIYDILYAAHWDVDENNPIKIRVDNFPKEFEPIAFDTITEWNIAFTKALNPEVKNPRKNYKKYLVGESVQAKHSFDLRYPTITWVSDKDISAGGTLGVGLAHADVNNGEILWGNVTIFGAFLENYMRKNLPEGGALSSSLESMGGPLHIPMKKQHLELANFVELNEYYMDSDIDYAIPTQFDALKAMNDVYGKNEVEKNLSAYNIHANYFATEAGHAMKQFIRSSQQEAELYNFTEVLGEPFLNANEVSDKEAEERFLQKLEQKVVGRDIHQAFDRDLNIHDKIEGWKSGIEASGRDYDEALRSIIKGLLLHEVGHMLGHGHNFKDNILPERGSVPDKYLDGDPKAALKIERDGMIKRASHEGHFTNYSTVMGYMDPRAELMIDYEDFVAGPHDVLLTRYLYRGEYPVYKKGDKDFKFEPVAYNGEIPAHSAKDSRYKTAFFKACNDWDVMLSGDPYCDRHIRGSSAEDLRINYVSSLYDGLAARLISFEPGGRAGNPEYGLWYRSLKTFGRLRMFYDHMRQQFDKDFKDLAKNEDNLYRFYEGCTGKGESNATLDALFAKKPKLKELCQVNYAILEDIERFVGINAVDHTRYNRDKRYSPSGLKGGDYYRQDFSRYDGSWVEASAYPIKLSALYNMTTTAPYVYHWWFGMWPLSRFRDAYSRYSMASYYPLKYSNVLTEALMSNLQFSNGTDGLRTKVGRLVFSVGYFDYLNRITNDSLFIPDTVDERLERQNSIDMSMGLIYLKEQFKEDSSSRVTHFTGKLFDFRSKETEDLNTGIYMLPNKKFITKGLRGTFLLPLTEIRFFSRNADDKGLAYSFVLKVSFDPDSDRKYPSLRALNQLANKRRDIYNQCVQGVNGAKNGLSEFFKSDFEGFEYSSNIGGQPTKQEDFFRSVDEAFRDKYYNSDTWDPLKEPTPQEEVCTEASTGLDVITSSAAALRMIFLRPLFRKSEVQ